ncbi:hypothetical protein ABXV18_24560 [Vibrio owensii]|uniref:hypothetical protein n=1 Tax=Vibrio owensii TaxID=696485 RepID=UPI0033929CD1
MDSNQYIFDLVFGIIILFLLCAWHYERKRYKQARKEMKRQKKVSPDRHLAPSKKVEGKSIDEYLDAPIGYWGLNAATTSDHLDPSPKRDCSPSESSSSNDSSSSPSSCSND